MDTASLVLDCPRGRFFCAIVGYRCSDDERAAGHYRPRSTGEVLDVLGAVDVHAIARLPERDLLDALALAVDFARYWQPPDEEDIVFARPEIVAVLRPIAEAASAAPHTRWWTEPIDLGHQRLVEKFNSLWGWSELPLRIGRVDDGLERWREHVMVDEARFRKDLIADPGTECGGKWWSTPVADGTVMTTRARDGLGALELWLEEDSMGGDHARVWPVRVQGSPRVYEITSPADWAHLVDNYPLPVPASRRSVWYDTTGEHHDWFIPDWLAVSADYDAVHLTMRGYLTTPGIAIPLTANPGATVLAGWNPDATFWLRGDHITVDGDPVEWRRTQDDPWAVTV
ncbi:hypothetical protein [Rhodococcus sp. NPDC127528]|uniref:hypothetical protein n=1 Tax=unclassified Rhodococcus (in: high G+C Gram-positive bacteria) TaxID=192944 RepID=UPI00363DA745